MNTRNKPEYTQMKRHKTNWMKEVLCWKCQWIVCTKRQTTEQIQWWNAENKNWIYWFLCHWIQ